MRKRRLFALLVVLLLSVALGACGGSEKATPSAETPGASPSSGPVTIDFWHSEVASNQETLNRLAEQFNASQNEVKVRVSFQGTYDDAMAKLIASLPSKNVPALMFAGDTYMQTMIDSGAVVSVQDLVDRDGYDLSDLDQKGIQFCTSQGKLRAMPFTMEAPLLFYNKIPFQEVGLDPEKPPQDLEELRQDSEKLLKRDAAGNVVRSGIALDIGPWMERVFAGHGDYFVDNENGRQGRATKVLFDNDTGRWFFQWWHDMVDSGLALNVGRNPSAADALLAIASGRASMAFANTGALRSVLDVLATGVQGVDVGIGRLPGVPGSTGTALTAYGLWILNVRPKAEQEAAWKFVKWLMEPEQQAEWFAGSGYLPASRSSVNLPAAEDAVARYPLFRFALDLYLNASATPATFIADLGPFQKVRDAVYSGIEEMLSGSADPEQALKDAASNANAAIADYNKRLGG